MHDILHNKLYYSYYNSKRMKAVLVAIVAVVTCVFVVGQTQTQDCMNRLAGLNSCTAQLVPGAAREGNFCSDCSSRLISYYRECLNGTQQLQMQVDAVQRSKLSSWLY